MEFRLEIDAIEERYGRRSTMFASHVSVDRWREIIAEAYADAILDRLVHIGGHTIKPSDDHKSRTHRHFA